MPSPTKQSESILIVDDQPANIQILRTMLQSRGYFISSAFNADEALEVLSQMEPDIILLDIMMPGLNGFELCQQLKANEATQQIPIIFISALHDMNDKRKAFQVGGVDYITKPFNIEEVMVRVHTHLKIRSMQRQLTLQNANLTADVQEGNRTNARLNAIVEERTQQLQKINRRMGVILNNISDAIVLLDGHGKIELGNRSMDTQWGYHTDELYQRHFHVLFHTDCHTLIDQAIEQLTQENRTIRLELVAQRVDGGTFDVEAIFTNIHFDELNIVCSIHDISHRKEVERLKDDFIMTVSHELRTPVTNLKLSAGGLQRYYDRMRDEQRQQKITDVMNQINILTELIENILDISRLERKHNESYAVQVDVVMRDMLAEMETATSLKHQTLEVLVSSPLPLGLANEQHLDRIWRNLITNAIKYTPEEGHVSIRVGKIWRVDNEPFRYSPEIYSDDVVIPQNLPHDEYVVGQVIDTGYGMSESDLNHIFERFYRGWAEHSRIPGTGLGLSLVKELLLRHGGDIHVSSQLGQGSIFTFWLVAQY